MERARARARRAFACVGKLNAMNSKNAHASYLWIVASNVSAMLTNLHGICIRTAITLKHEWMCHFVCVVANEHLNYSETFGINFAAVSMEKEIEMCRCQCNQYAIISSPPERQTAVIPFWPALGIDVHSYNLLSYGFFVLGFLTICRIWWRVTRKGKKTNKTVQRHGTHISECYVTKKIRAIAF